MACEPRRPSDGDPSGDVEHPDDEYGSHNRLGYLNVDEAASSSERGAEEPEISEDVEQHE